MIWMLIHLQTPQLNLIGASFPGNTLSSLLLTLFLQNSHKRINIYNEQKIQRSSWCHFGKK
jgi:hypothetical protein